MVKWEQPRVGRVWLSYVAQDRQKALMGSKEQNKLVFGAKEHLNGPWALSFFFHGLQSTLFTTVGSQRPREIFNFFFSIFFPPSSPLAPAHAKAHEPTQMGTRRAPDRGIAPGADRTNLLEAAFPPMCSGARAMSVRWRPLSSPPSPRRHGVCVFSRGADERS